MTDVQLDINALQRSGTEIARYRVSAGEPVVIGHRADDGAEIVDVPANGSGPSYMVDRGYHDGAGLQAFVKDYLGQAARLDCCPMDGEVLEELLADTDGEVVDDLVAAMWALC